MTTAHTTAEAERAEEILDHRVTLAESVQAATAYVTDARKIRAKLTSNYLYDVEHAENQDSVLADRFLAQANDALRAAAAILRDIHRDPS
jgi:hypothetical protein